MKIFVIEEKKEVVYLQNKDVNLLLRNNIPDDIKNELPMVNVLKQDQFLKISNEMIVNWLKNAYYILDYNEFKNMTNEEKNKRYLENNNNIKNIYSKLEKIPKKKRKTYSGLYAALYTLEFYKQSMEEYFSDNFSYPKTLKKML